MPCHTAIDGLSKYPIESNSTPQAGILCYRWLITRNGAVVARIGPARSQNINSNVAEYLALIEGLMLWPTWGQTAGVGLRDAKTIIDQMLGDRWSTSHGKPLFKQAQLSRTANLTCLDAPQTEPGMIC
jgi:hypothetical protein